MKLADLRKAIRGVHGNANVFVNDEKGVDHTKLSVSVHIDGQERSGDRRTRRKDVLVLISTSQK